MLQPVSEFFPSELTVSVTIGGTAINVIYLSPYEVMRLAGGLEVSSNEPRIVCKASDVSTVTINTTVTYGSTTYYVTSIEPDGTGVTVLTLSLENAI